VAGFAAVSSHRPGKPEFIGLTLFFALTQSWFGDYALYGNFPSWSLSIEAFFYALFPWAYSQSHQLSLLTGSNIFWYKFSAMVVASALAYHWLQVPARRWLRAAPKKQ